MATPEQAAPRRWGKPVAPFEIEVRCVIDEASFQFTTWSDMSALLAIRLNGSYGKPRRGCESGNCGACESTLNGDLVRLCQLSPTALVDGVIVTGTN